MGDLLYHILGTRPDPGRHACLKKADQMKQLAYILDSWGWLWHRSICKAVHMRYVVPVSLSTLIKMCVTGFSARFSHNTDGLAPDRVQGKCWPECPRHCSASAENLRKEEMRSCSQARLSDDGLVSLVALKSSHSSNAAPDAPCGPREAAQVTTNYFPF